MINPVALLVAIQAYMSRSNQHLLSCGHSDPGEGIERIARRHMTRAREKSRRRLRKTSQRYNRLHS